MSVLPSASADEVATDPVETALGDGELIVVSNRQPYRHDYDADDDIVVDRPVGGLTAGLDPVMRRTDGTWIAWGDGDADAAVTDEGDRVRVPPEGDDYTLRRVWLSDEQVSDYYYGYSNRVLWPLCHGFPTEICHHEDYWTSYREVNATFAEATADRAETASVVWFNDYHLALAPRQVRPVLGDDATIMTFWHIPWPDPSTFRRCPEGREVLRGLLANDLLGFHVESYCANFAACATTHLDDARADPTTGEIRHRDGTTVVRSFPLGVDVTGIARGSRRLSDGFWDRFCSTHGIDPSSRVAVGVDRLDYTKGIPERIRALERFWERNPEWRGRLTYVQKESESRSRIPAYERLQDQVAREADRVNQRFGTTDWTPIVRIDGRLSPRDLYGLYRHGDLALVTPLRDGMNLVAQEYVAAQQGDPGVLILSEFAGVHESFGDAALSVNPHDRALGGAIERALKMDDAERRRRIRTLRERAAGQRLDAWLSDLFTAAAEVGATRDRPAEA